MVQYFSHQFFECDLALDLAVTLASLAKTTFLTRYRIILSSRHLSYNMGTSFALLRCY
jgi:hypothetical protein